MKFLNLLTGEELGLMQLLEYYKLEPIPELVGCTPLDIPKNNLQDCGENNGGKTSYYDLPTVEDSKLMYILSNKIKESTPVECRIAADAITKLLPTTLNDLIEYKDMYPFQHEIFKACYALQERANKDIKGGSILRELNKMKYYIERGIALAKEGKI